MLDSLSELQMTALLLSEKDSTRNKLDIYYDSLGADITHLNPESSQYSVVEEYVKQGSTGHNPPEILQVYKVNRWEEAPRFEPFRTDLAHKEKPTKQETPNLLLWHGSSVSNFVGILSQGLRIAPPEAPASGYMFGKGIYFADVFDKSFGYCRGGSPASLLLLCEVAIGKPYRLKDSEYMEQAQEGFNSTMGCGNNVPHDDGLLITPKGVGIPLGKVHKHDDGEEYCLHYNEYIL